MQGAAAHPQPGTVETNTCTQATRAAVRSPPLKGLILSSISFSIVICKSASTSCAPSGARLAITACFVPRHAAKCPKRRQNREVKQSHGRHGLSQEPVRRKATSVPTGAGYSSKSPEDATSRAVPDPEKGQGSSRDSRGQHRDPPGAQTQLGTSSAPQPEGCWRTFQGAEAIQELLVLLHVHRPAPLLSWEASGRGHPAATRARPAAAAAALWPPAAQPCLSLFDDLCSNLPPPAEATPLFANEPAAPCGHPTHGSHHLPPGGWGSWGLRVLRVFRARSSSAGRGTKKKTARPPPGTALLFWQIKD